jgi:hypothetical protein
MKPTLFALTAFVLGSALGWIATRAEFAKESLPLDEVRAAASGSTGESKKVGPKAVVVNGARYDFGTIDRFASDSHEFEILNGGDQPLTLKIGKSTCKCTKFATEKDALDPGEKTKVKLEWTVKTGDPMFEQSAELITNDPSNNPVQLTIHGSVVDTLRPDRPQLSLGDVSANEPQTFRMRVHTYRDHDLAIDKHEWLGTEGVDHLEVSFVPLTPEQVAQEKGAYSGVEVVLVIQPGLPLGRLAQTLRLTTNLPNRDPVEIPVMGTIVSDITLVGGNVSADQLRVNMGTLDHGAQHTKTVFLVVKGPFREQTTLQIESVTPAQEIEARLGEPIGDNPKVIRYPLSLVISASAVPVVRNSDETFAQIKLAITHPQVKEMTIRVRYVLK